MDDTPDPATQFFPGVAPEDINLYATLGLTKDTKAEDIKKAYRKLALIYHPDKHANSTDSAKEAASVKFQQVGFAYAVLSDETRRKRYDQTGRTDEGAGLEPGEGGWEAYFEDLFDNVTRGKLDEMKKEYQGSDEEVNDLKEAYIKCQGSIDGIMAEIPHSTYDDEDRFVRILTPLVKKGDVPKYSKWQADIKDKKGKERRRAEGEREAKEAEEHAKAMGVWDEFYGSGKEGPRKGKGKGKEPELGDGDESTLQALILKRQQKRGGILDGLLAKYGAADAAESAPKKRGSKRKAEADEDLDEAEEVPTLPKKKARTTAAGAKTRAKKVSKGR
ncbi:hypothetical protein FRC01_001546 [Tulasnella sp. 417]|nr:hypothetical protein FRC01_001546 [Tulasnella sp. 417]